MWEYRPGGKKRRYAGWPRRAHARALRKSGAGSPTQGAGFSGCAPSVSWRASKQGTVGGSFHKNCRSGGEPPRTRPGRVPAASSAVSPHRNRGSRCVGRGRGGRHAVRLRGACVGHVPHFAQTRNPQKVWCPGGVARECALRGGPWLGLGLKSTFAPVRGEGPCDCTRRAWVAAEYGEGGGSREDISRGGRPPFFSLHSASRQVSCGAALQPFLCDRAAMTCAGQPEQICPTTRRVHRCHTLEQRHVEGPVTGTVQACPGRKMAPTGRSRMTTAELRAWVPVGVPSKARLLQTWAKPGEAALQPAVQSPQEHAKARAAALGSRVSAPAAGARPPPRHWPDGDHRGLGRGPALLWTYRDRTATGQCPRPGDPARWAGGRGWEKTAAGAGRTRTGRGPHDRIQQGGL
eukprot:gene19049-biopygen19019